jgi:hypothetical protein
MYTGYALMLLLLTESKIFDDLCPPSGEVSDKGGRRGLMNIK